MRIGILAESFEGGGAERQAAIWVQTCAEQDHDVTAITLRETGHPIESSDIRFVCVPKDRTSDFIAVGRRLRRLQRDLDAIVAFEPFLGLCCAFARLHIPWMLVTGKVPYKLRENSRIPMSAFRSAFKRAALASAPSRGVIECHRRMGLRTHGSWRAIPNVADESAFTQSIHERSGILFVGRLVAVKNPLLAVESAAAAGAPLTLLGEGDQQPIIEERLAAQTHAPPVTILPFEREPWPVYARHRVLAVTSVVESFGNVLVESLAAGTPVVSVDCDFGPREILDGASYSHLAGPRAEEIAAALIEVLRRPYSEAEKAECQAIADRYRPTRIAPSIAEAIDQLKTGA